MFENSCSIMKKICFEAFIIFVFLFLFSLPANSVKSYATAGTGGITTNSEPASLDSVNPNTTIVDPTSNVPANTPINQTPYWPAAYQKIHGYTDDVYIPEDTAQTLWNGTTGNGSNIPTVSGTVNGVKYTAGQSVIPNSTFNALYYYLNYKDVRDAIGANPQVLVDNWVLFGGVGQGRVANGLIVRDGASNDSFTQYGSSSYEYIVPSYKKTSNSKDGMVVIPGQVHGNGGMNRKQEIQARSVAYQVAEHVFQHVRQFGKGSQIEMVAYATGIVRAYCDRGTFTTDGTMYRTAYGVFLQGEYSSAGATRALGLVVDYLDELCQKWNQANPDAKDNYGPLKWVHKNVNTWEDQYMQLVCDYHEAYADPVAALTGYGKHPNEGGRRQDYQTYVSFAFESDIITTRPPIVDSTQAPVTKNAPDKNKNIQNNNNTY